eukprot:15132-Heterococcus_DN1.PRE.1
MSQYQQRTSKRVAIFYSHSTKADCICVYVRSCTNWHALRLQTTTTAATAATVVYNTLSPEQVTAPLAVLQAINTLIAAAAAAAAAATAATTAAAATAAAATAAAVTAAAATAAVANVYSSSAFQS